MCAAAAATFQPPDYCPARPKVQLTGNDCCFKYKSTSTYSMLDSNQRGERECGRRVFWCCRFLDIALPTGGTRARETTARCYHERVGER
jgi:hypothetical protein